MKRELKVIDGKDYLFDENNNRVCLTRFDSKTAEAMLNSLTDCTNCTDCRDCIKCVGCISCTNCISCDYCTDCSIVAGHKNHKYKLPTTWVNLGNRLFNAKDMARISMYSSRSEKESNDEAIEEVLLYALDYTKLPYPENITEEELLASPLEVLVALYQEVSFKKVLDKLDFPKK